MVKSLIGKADGVLVNAAFKEAASQIPLNMSGIMATMTETQKQLDKQFVDMTTELFGNINSANEEMQELVNRLFSTKHPYYCPHGRPIIMQLSLEELDKRFERI